ncbi:hypothetical protein ABE61_10160 [Lysinibacillus sphaericus]|nr:hypothetical protein [Lysinibacillus sphaericus]MBG9593070.1 hypothetical protein [Lysinibacillus sphaericus]
MLKDSSLGYKVLGEIEIQFMQFLFIVLMDWIFQFYYTFIIINLLKIKHLNRTRNSWHLCFVAFTYRYFQLNFDTSILRNVHFQIINSLY